MTAAQNLASELERDQNQDQDQAALSLEKGATKSPDTAVELSAVSADDIGVTATKADAVDKEDSTSVAAETGSHVATSVSGSEVSEVDDISQLTENPYVSPVRTTDQDLDQLHTIGAILRYHRQRAGLSLQEVACKL